MRGTSWRIVNSSSAIKGPQYPHFSSILAPLSRVSVGWTQESWTSPKEPSSSQLIASSAFEAVFEFSKFLAWKKLHTWGLIVPFGKNCWGQIERTKVDITWSGREVRILTSHFLTLTAIRCRCHVTIDQRIPSESSCWADKEKFLDFAKVKLKQNLRSEGKTKDELPLHRS